MLFSIVLLIVLFFQCVRFRVGCIGVRGGVEDTRLEAKAKDTKKIRGQGQGQSFRGQNLSRPRTRMLEAKAKDTGASVLQKKKGLQKIFSGNLQFIGVPRIFDWDKAST